MARANTDRVTFTLDVEDHRESDAQEIRFPQLTREVLDFLDARDVRGTFFVVGEVARDQPELVREVAARGHELALHGWRHVPLTDLDPATFRADVARGKALLEDLGQQPVGGFRAPTFSLVPASRWAVDVLAEEGFTYSSSVLPAKSPLFGDPALPTAPFHWPNGLAELPCPVVRGGPVGLPYLGGVYMRAIPGAASAGARAVVGRNQLLWIYCHPYDFDPGEPFWVVPDAGPMGSRLLWYNRRRTFAKIERILHGRAGLPLGERLHEIDATATLPPTAAPSTSEAP